ncbi:MAG: acetylornithine deacetylase [Halopseudomonas aestusnigri]
MSRDFSPVVDLLEALVGFATVSDRPNTDLIKFVADYLDRHKVRYHIFPDATGEKQGLIAHIGPEVAGGVILSGHTDVVPVEGQVWSSDPFTLSQRVGRYVGRGTCDMKGFLALALAAVPHMVAAPLKRPVQLAFSFDEEVGCIGTGAVLDALEQHFPRADAVIVGEPTEMGVVSGHKGGIGMVTRINGKAAHSSRPDLGVSAISYAAQVIAWHVAQMDKARLSSVDLGFVPPYSTAQVGTISGGVALNTVAELCTLETDIRHLPTENARDWIAPYQAELAQIEQAMKSEHSEASIVLEITETVPAMISEANGVAEALARRLTGDNTQRFVSYQTEAGHFQAAGYSTVVCGPGSIEQAHKPDEFITVAQLRHGQAFMAALIETLIQG